MKKTDLIHKLKQLQGISDDERAYLINLVNTKKKYGLVWEEKPEDVEEQLREKLPVLKEVKDRAIINGEEYPNHILIEGDNLHALTALTFTHEGKIDVIYIDPPYNTGNKDFKYNDTFVDKEDSYRHSKWLSFMNKRLEIAKRLLNNTGVIFISIDDNENAQLRILCNDILGEMNFVETIVWQKNFAPRSSAKHFSSNHDYVLCYAKSINELKLNLLPRSSTQNDRYKNPDNDPRGVWTSDNLTARNYYSLGTYPITNPAGRVIEGPPKGTYWRVSEENFKKLVADNRIWFGFDGNGVPRLKRFLSEVQDGVIPQTIWLHTEAGNTQEAKKEVLSVFGEDEGFFSTPKPLKLISRLLQISSSRNSIICDFFAGSGTTLHATMQLNAEDGGTRQCILVTNNENNICEEVTYERNRRVIQGYNNAKGEMVEGISGNNLRYYKSEFVGREPSVKNKREITRLATELLCIKEDIYAEQKQVGAYLLNTTYVRCFQQGSLYLLVIYDEDVIEQMVEVIQSVVEEDASRNTHFKVYVFSNGQYPYTEEFEEVLPYVTLCALPDAIYKAYQHVLPKRKKQPIPQLEEPTAEEVENQLNNEIVDLFNQR